MSFNPSIVQCISENSKLVSNEDESASFLDGGIQSVSVVKPVSDSTLKIELIECENQSECLNFLKLRLCANPSCRVRAEDLQIAPYFVCAYFGLQVESPKVRRVCDTCYKEAEKHQNILVGLLREQKSIVFGPKKPKTPIITIDDEDDVEEFLEYHEEVEVKEDMGDFVKLMMEKYKFDQQIDASCQLLEQNLSKHQIEMTKLDTAQQDLEKSLELLQKELYDSCQPNITHLQSVDIDQKGNVVTHTVTPSPSLTILPAKPSCPVITDLPPPGILVYTPLQVSQTVYAMKTSILAHWVKGRVAKITEDAETLYTVNFEAEGNTSRMFPLKYLAYTEPSHVQLTVGVRVIAQYVGGNFVFKQPRRYYAGVIAEPPKCSNRYRYLVFFDDGYAQYCTHGQIKAVCHSSAEVWHDVYVNSRTFMSLYLKQYPERAMVKLKPGQTIRIESNNSWHPARVDEIDASLAKVYYLTENRFEWIYRGSTRLQPLFNLLAKAEARKKQGTTRPTHNVDLIHKKKNDPYVEYTTVDDEEEEDKPTEVVPSEPSQVAPVQPVETVARAVARKSTSKTVKPFKLSTPPLHRTLDKGLSAENRGKLNFLVNKKYHEVRFEPHQCGNKCIEDFPFTDGDHKNVNPLTIPMLCGWAREIAKRHADRRTVIYRAPCGRRMRNLVELHRYLRLTGSQLGIDLFCFDNFVHCFTEFEPQIVYNRVNDITYGKENVRVSCVNSIDRSTPDYVEYTTKRIPRDTVKLNLDPDFLLCCDCTDDCQDKEKCQCWQLTIKATARGTDRKVNKNAGYQYRRLLQHFVTGIYECNSRCSCRSTCLNRVAQRPLQLRLQLFKTEKRGWGIRCLDDIPQGQFICAYTGEILTEQEANSEGKKFCDEYLADLNHIETKEGYESDVTDIEEMSSESQASSSDDEWKNPLEVSELNRSIIRTRKKNKLREEKQMAPSPILSTEDIDRNGYQKSLRKFYGSDERCYVIDAKNIGNIGRYLNHSCVPNGFVQHIFTDTQDLRFPWVGFFALRFIRAGTELTWDYMYEVGSVPNKKLYCQCGEKECRGRLL